MPDPLPLGPQRVLLAELDPVGVLDELLQQGEALRLAACVRRQFVVMPARRDD